ncbi:MAG: transporter permease [Alphaproteobacteria bacterium]|jgi:peptide/nickel transport system permease protein|nr:transporter permease [Alphaproteobacteria bacterium]
MYAYVGRRVLGTLPVILVIALVIFLILHLSGGDPAAIIAGDHATDEDIKAIRDKLGLDRPLAEQFLTWLWNVVQGDFGISIFNRVPVGTLILQRVEPTLMLTLTVIVFSIILALPMGIAAAWYAGTWIDRALMALAVLSFSLPVFVIGYGLVYAFSLQVPILPVQGYRSLADGIGPFARHMVLPTISLGLVYTALLARMTRSSFLEVLSQDYIRSARAKGMASFQLITIHALKNASVPIVTTIGSGIAVLIGGVVVTESVFAIPGIGRLTVDALLRSDFPVIQGVILVFSFFYVILNLAIDLLYTVLDPRIRY